MPDTRRSKSSLATLLADNTSGDISAQDARDEMVSAHPENVIQTAAYASEPSSGQLTGDLFFPNNSVYIERWSGSAWSPWGPIWQMTKPVDGDFSWANQGGSSIVTTNGGIVLVGAASGGNQLRVRHKTAPSTPYTITAAFRWNYDFNNLLCGAGILFRQSSDGKIVWHGHGARGVTPVSRLWHVKFDAANNYNSYYATYEEYTQATNGLFWFRISDDGTDRKFWISSDGYTWMLMHSIGRTDFLTADQVGFGVFAEGAATMSLMSWKQE